MTKNFLNNWEYLRSTHQRGYNKRSTGSKLPRYLNSKSDMYSDAVSISPAENVSYTFLLIECTHESPDASCVLKELKVSINFIHDAQLNI